MNKNAIREYAIWARNELISKVTQKAYEFGVSENEIIDKNVDSVHGNLLSSLEKKQRNQLIDRVSKKGFSNVIEEVAYTWFNRFIALRYMEVNNYLPNRVRVFTDENNAFNPQVLSEAIHLEMNNIDKNSIYEMIENNKREELYKYLLIATCDDMVQYLPGMFTPVSDYNGLLCPDDLLKSDSVIGKMISNIDEDSWYDQVQIIGWLYQFYNTEPKAKVYARKNGEKIKKEEVPAVTQLFTPDWIVKYMVENSLGRLWIDGHPNSDIKGNWKYYLDEAEQEDAVKAELEKIKEEHSHIRPDDIKFIDPCMGSGHILVYAFDVLMQIYVSEGWTARDAAKSILQNNIYGLDIDERAYQLSYFALMMKARQYSRRILTESIVPNVMDIQESNGYNKELLDQFGENKELARRLADTFIDAKEYGSILNVPLTLEEIDKLDAKLDEINRMSDYGSLMSQLFSMECVEVFTPLLRQAKIMVQKYDAVVTNPPYMAGSGMSSSLSNYVNKYYFNEKQDLFSVMISKDLSMTKQNAFCSQVTMQSWMFLSSFENMRRNIIENFTISNLMHMDNMVMGIAFGTAVSIFRKCTISSFKGTYNQVKYVNIQNEEPFEFPVKENRFAQISQTYFSKIPGSPVAYWVSNNFISAFDENRLSVYAEPKSGIMTGNNELFLKVWFEVDAESFNTHAKTVDDTLSTEYKWYPYNKGGAFRRWYGNRDYVVNMQNKGYDIANSGENNNYRLRDQSFYFKEGITWSSLTNGLFNARYCPESMLNDSKGPLCYVHDNNKINYILGAINSKVAQEFFRFLAPTLDYNLVSLASMPIPSKIFKNHKIDTIVFNNINYCKIDWDSFEISWDFKIHPFLKYRGYSVADRTCINTGGDEYTNCPVEYAYVRWMLECDDRFNLLKANEEELNRIFIDIYGLQDELTPEVEDENVTVRKADLTRDVKSLISYAVGCMFGRYSLTEEGLVYAGGEWNPYKYGSYVPVNDNCIPITDDEYFENDIVSRFVEFIKQTFGEDELEDNLKYISSVLGGNGTPRQIIRNYFLNDFFKDHCNTYQVTGSGKRPIYWQFDSGKKNGFKCLMYIHKYTPDQIAKIRTEYVLPLQSKYRSTIDMLEKQIESASTTAEKVKLTKELSKIKDQALELKQYEEKIHHWADKMEPMDLDDGVKVNYAKFQELLAKIK